MLTAEQLSEITDKLESLLTLVIPQGSVELVANLGDALLIAKSDLAEAIEEEAAYRRQYPEA